MTRIKQYLKSFLYRFKKSKIKAVYDDDLIEVLESLGVLDVVKKGESICVYCKKPVSFDNLQALFSKDGDIKFICSNPDCIAKI